MISTYFYSKEAGFKRDLSRAEMLNIITKNQGTLWVDLEEPTDLECELLVEIFNFHELAIEDCLNDQCHPKMDDYGDYLFINMEALALKTNGDEKRELTSSEISIFFGPNYVVTFHKQPISSIGMDRSYAEKKPQTYIGEGAGALLHTIIDHMVDSYIPIVHQYDDKVDELENDIFKDPPNYLSTLMRVKQDVFRMRRVFGPERDMMYTLARTRSLVDKEHELYFRDVYDHLSHVQVMNDGLYENLTGILQVYFSYASTKLNEVMKRMTIMATITMPALLIFSLYGMNFEWMPFLKHPLGFWISQAVTGFAAFGMLIWMKFKKWI